MKRQTAHKQNRFLNCLRIQVVPGYYEEQRIKSIVDFCKKHAFDNVMLFINAEEYSTGHMTKEEAKPWVDAMKRVKNTLVKEGITISLNPWMEIGHLDRGRKLKENQDFVTQVDYNGTRCELVACPMDENWLKYFLDFYDYLIREIEPEVVWIEDDFRLHNHSPLEYGGCFCEHHMKAFNEKLGTNYSRDEFVDLLFRKHPDEKVKKAFLEVNRLHLPLYWENISTKKYYLDFNYYSFICRGYLPEDCHVLPELENGSFMIFGKDSETLRFQLEAAIPLEIEGMTYDIFDFVGNGAIEAFEYGEGVASVTDYLTAVMESGYSYSKLSGITILLDEKNAYNRPIKESFYDMYPNEFYFGAMLQAHGISARCSKEKEFQNEVIVLAAGSVCNFSDEQLEKLFRDNHVILEGEAAKLLIDRGLGHLIGASAYKIYKSDYDIQSYEQIEGDTLVYGIPGYRASAFSRTGDYIDITYDCEPCIKSRVFDFAGNEVGYGMVTAGKHLIVPYTITDFQIDLLHPLRGRILCDYIDSLEKNFARADYSNIYAYYSKAEQNILILVNPTNHTLKVTRFKLTGDKVARLYEIERDGSKKEKEFVLDEEGFVVIEEQFEALTTKTFALEISNSLIK